MYKALKIVSVVVVLSAVFAGGSYLAIKHYFSGMDELSSCNEEVKQQINSPNKKNIATVLVRNCGSTTNYVTHVNIKESGELAKQDYNDVITVGDVWVAKGMVPVKLYWKDDMNLEIVLPKNVAINTTESETKWGSINILVQK